MSVIPKYFATKKLPHLFHCFPQHPFLTSHPSSGFLFVIFFFFILHLIWAASFSNSYILHNLWLWFWSILPRFFWACESVFKITYKNWAVITLGYFTLRRPLLLPFPEVEDVPNSWTSTALIPQRKAVCTEVYFQEGCNEPTSRNSQNTMFSITVEFTWMKWNEYLRYMDYADLQEGKNKMVDLVRKGFSNGRS